jgi:anti-sigma B factor antagonist
LLDPTTESQEAERLGLAGGLRLASARPSPGVAVLGVGGELDSLTTPELAGALSELLGGPEERFVVDLTAVTFLASSGLAVLIRGAEQVAERDLRLRLVTTTRAVRRPLEVTGSDQLFDLFTDLESAIVDPV